MPEVVKWSTPTTVRLRYIIDDCRRPVGVGGGCSTDARVGGTTVDNDAVDHVHDGDLGDDGRIPPGK